MLHDHHFPGPGNEMAGSNRRTNHCRCDYGPVNTQRTPDGTQRRIVAKKAAQLKSKIEPKKLKNLTKQNGIQSLHTVLDFSGSVWRGIGGSICAEYPSDCRSCFNHSSGWMHT